ncbi:MAG: phage tail protein I [Kluyvera sp.]|uniref:phage tail protein I n=1 Tax=Kluyvera sp. TaxID=1538228 RepID=UPI003A87FDBA
MIPSILLKKKSLKAVKEISQKEMASLTPVIRQLVIMDIDNVLPQFLPFLAAWFRVEYWDSSWTIPQQRQKVKQALVVFKKLGTPDAVEQTIDFLSEAYGYPLKLTEWFDMQPEGTRGTFIIDLLSGDEGFQLNDEFYNKLFSGVERNKRGSQHWGLRIKGNVSGTAYVGSYLYSSEFGSVISNE